MTNKSVNPLSSPAIWTNVRREVGWRAEARYYWKVSGRRDCSGSLLYTATGLCVTFMCTQQFAGVLEKENHLQ